VTTTPTRFAAYLRLSTTDKQDPSLSFPSQRKACERKVGETSGEVVCEFTDQETGAKQDRPGWSMLVAEARDQENRRFDAVVIYSTSRLARDRLYATLFERELRKVGVSVHYATGAGDTTTPEGQMFVGMQQLWDEFERSKLARETKRGMREGTEQGYRMGGRAPYGYERESHDLPEGHRGADKQRIKLIPKPDEARVVAEIFHLHADQGWGLKAIADHLNRPGGPPPPSHVDRSRNRRGHWATSTLRSMLRNPVYTGHMVWNRLDFANARQNGGAPRLRAQEEWVIADDSHLPLISDETFRRSQERFKTRPRRQHTNGSSNSRSYMFAGMVYCATDHQPLSMQGKARKSHHYYACSYGATYGDIAAAEVHAGQKWIYLREDALLPLVEQFFAKRVFGPMRLDKLARQLQTHDRQRKRNGQLLATRLRQQIAEADRKIKIQVQALEDGIEPEIVTARIVELRADRQAAQDALNELTPDEIAAEDDYLAQRIARIPDLAQSLHDAAPEIKRQTFQAFDLRIEFDKAQRRIQISATVTEAVAQAFENTKALQSEGFQVTVNGIAGAGFEPATFGL
jgi:DNA invertase Pin-like site-specific DNA recombinase